MQRRILSTIETLGFKYKSDLSQGIDISIGHIAGPHGVRCFSAPFLESSPLQIKSEGKVVFSGAVKAGARCNCFGTTLFPHISGTHTEGLPHITSDIVPVGELIEGQMFLAELITVAPAVVKGDPLLPDGDLCVLRESIQAALSGVTKRDAIIIRTLPNDDGKLVRDYSGTNPVYLHYEAAQLLVELGITHLLVDLPSLDREDGELFSHRVFFQYPIDERTGGVVTGLEGVRNEPRRKTTITELIYVPNSTLDGTYLLNLNPVIFPGDAAPTRPIIYPLTPL